MQTNTVPSLTALCVTKLARGAPPRALTIVLRYALRGRTDIAISCVLRISNSCICLCALLFVLCRRLPEELVMSVLAGMIASNTLTDDRLATFFVVTRRVLKLEGCSAIRNSILRQIPFRCPQLVRYTTAQMALMLRIIADMFISLIGCPHSAAWTSRTARR